MREARKAHEWDCDYGKLRLKQIRRMFDRRDWLRRATDDASPGAARVRVAAIWELQEMLESIILGEGRHHA